MGRSFPAGNFPLQDAVHYRRGPRMPEASIVIPAFNEQANIA
jgi:hypothetical protein